MGERLEKRYRLTMSWNYEKEEQWINELSEQGLHLKKAGALKSFFTNDPTTRYTYRLDYQPGLKKNHAMQDYLDLYQDAGWEYVVSYGSAWHYFRKEFIPGEPPRLYTDRESLIAQYKKIQRVMGGVFIANIVIFSANMTNLLSRFSDRLWGIIVPVMAIYFILFVLLGFGYVKTGNKIKKLVK
ncbi:hypothetical protein J23TS9_21330 [Paenibacillus sp. J23TS9]|uniref:DUF2812 domain-containing protein n=1 Tax=Paenibacillus sp. J23TS9 TaxID=2807193 RepID=UPI001AFE736E|nr:DUF2812 domain-containing protein [Paenibacillus sp. J23TS9]GIP27003.1 hypothetical protein J23TS9_21330 [Paenibacillus sp. J23TS9]